MSHLRRVPHRIVINMAGKNAHLPLLMVIIMLSAPISGCFGKDALSPSDVEDHWLPPVERDCDYLFLPPMQSPYPEC